LRQFLNEISGKDHAGKPAEGEPALFGMAFQAFRFAQVIPTGGYTDASGTPSAPLLDVIEHTDQSIGKMVSALKSRGSRLDLNHHNRKTRTSADGPK